MKTKTFAIGERCRGGVISVDIKDNPNFPKDKVIHVINRDWDMSKGNTTKSDQSQAPIIEKQVFVYPGKDNPFKDPIEANRDIMEYLEELTHYCVAEDILKWIKNNI